jgi:hypothetical protein
MWFEQGYVPTMHLRKSVDLRTNMRQQRLVTRVV